MTVSYAELKARLDVDEPDYAALATLAAGAMQHLRKLAASDDLAVASKAVSLAGIIGDAGGIDVISDAASSRHTLVRVAAAHAASLLPDSPQAAGIIGKLLTDADVGIMKIATRAAARQSAPGIAVKARRASVRMATTMRAAAIQFARREKETAMAMKTRKKASGKAARGKAPARSAAAGQMPAGVMTEPPKSAKPRGMPDGKMN
jgi:hypothetical protein